MELEPLIQKVVLQVAKGDLQAVETVLEGIGEAAKEVLGPLALIGAAVGTIYKAAETAFEAVTSVAEKGTKIGRFAETLEMTAGEFQNLAAVAYMGDIELDKFATAMNKMAMVSAKAKEGVKGAAAAFAGIKLTGANGELRSSNDLLLDLADKFEKIPTASERLLKAQQIFGKGSAAEMSLLLSKGKGAIAETIEQYRASGAALTNAQVEEAEKFEEAQKRFKWNSEGLKNAFASADAIKALASLWDGFGKLLTNPAIRKTVEYLGKMFTNSMESLVYRLGLVNEWLTKIGNNPMFEASLSAFQLIWRTVDSISGVIMDVFGALSGSGLFSSMIDAIFGPAIDVVNAIFKLMDDVNVYLGNNNPALSMTGTLMAWFKEPIGEVGMLKYIHDVIGAIMQIPDKAREAWEALDSEKIKGGMKKASEDARIGAQIPGFAEMNYTQQDAEIAKWRKEHPGEQVSDNFFDFMKGAIAIDKSFYQGTFGSMADLALGKGGTPMTVGMGGFNVTINLPIEYHDGTVSVGDFSKRASGIIWDSLKRQMQDASTFTGANNFVERPE